MSAESLARTLKRPLAFIDLETTGTDIDTDRIVEISVLHLSPLGGAEVWSRHVNPEMNIPPEATAVHGITNSQVKSCLKFGQLASELASILSGCDLAGYNILGFDLPVLEASFHRTTVPFSRSGRIIIDSMKIFHTFFPRTLAGAYKLYTGEDLAGAHEATADVFATVRVFEEQMSFHAGLPRSIEEIGRFCYDSDRMCDANGKFEKGAGGEPVFTFGKYKGVGLKRVATENPGYLRWMLSEASFREDAKTLVKAALG